MSQHLFHYQYQDRERSAETARIDPFYSASLLALAFRLFPYGLSRVSLPIGESLADRALNRAGGALNVIYAQPDAIAISEIEIRKIPVQMLLCAVLVDAIHAALEDRIVGITVTLNLPNCFVTEEAGYVFGYNPPYECSRHSPIPLSASPAHPSAPCSSTPPARLAPAASGRAPAPAPSSRSGRSRSANR